MSIAGMQTINEYNNRQVVSIAGTEIMDNATLAPTDREIVKGTVLGIVTTSGLVAPYDNAESDGTEVARVILAESVAPSTLPQQISVYIGGVFYKNMLVGLDAAAITDMGMRETINGQVVLPV